MRRPLLSAFATLMMLSVQVHAEPASLQLVSASAALPVRRTTEALLSFFPGSESVEHAASTPFGLGLLGLDVDPLGLDLHDVPAEAESRGSPHRGRLRHGVRMPLNPELYLVRRPEYAYGSSNTVQYLQLAIAKFRKRSAYRGPIVISDISRQRGGRNRPHRSHQSGRDVDVWLPLQSDQWGITCRGGVPSGATQVDFEHFAAKRMREIDWQASWELMKALLRTGQVEKIFLSRSRQRQLYRAAQADGFDSHALEELIQYPGRSREAIIRHVPGHDKHAHVRFRCSPFEPRCRS